MNKHVVFQSDFGTSDGAVNAMYGVTISVDPENRIFDLTHDIPQFNIWEGSYRLNQAIAYWPEGTVFVSVVDPGVGSDRLSIVAKTKAGHYIVTPDNGTLTHINNEIGIEEVRVIDESINRLPCSKDSYTFHGRDVYAYTAARLAAGVISFTEVGHEIPAESIVTLEKPEAKVQDSTITGNVDILDVRFGNLWTNIDKSFFEEEDIHFGDTLEVTIQNNERVVFSDIIHYGKTFDDKNLGESLVFINSIGHVAIAKNQASFAESYNIGSGANWNIQIKKAPENVVKLKRKRSIADSLTNQDFIKKVNEK